MKHKITHQNTKLVRTVRRASIVTAVERVLDTEDIVTLRPEAWTFCKERATAIPPEDFIILPSQAITRKGDVYFSTLRRAWVPLSNSVGKRVGECDRGRILRMNPFIDVKAPTPNTREDSAGYTHGGPFIVRLFTEPARGLRDTTRVTFDVINRKHEEDFHGDFLLPRGVSVVALTDLALKYASVSPRGLTRFLARWIEVESSK